jgi:dipeptidyl-peptidase 4
MLLINSSVHQELPLKRILFVILLLASTAFAQTAAKKQYTIQSMSAEAGQAGPPQSLQWSPDGTKISFIRKAQGAQQEALYYYDPASGKDAVLIAADSMASMKPPTAGSKGDDRNADNRARYGVAAYHWSPDSKSILFDTMGHLWLFDLASSRGTQLTTSDEPTGDPKFSPDARFISFIRGHNLYVKPTASGAEVALTHDGNADLYNGEVDWLYEEELDVRSNYFWSPDSKQILFLQSNETPVPTYPIVDWIMDHPKMDPEKYPKAGDPNPTAKLAVTDVSGNIKWLPLSNDTNTYVPRFGWVRPGLAWAMVLNRRQNHADLYFVNTATGESKVVLSESDDKYIEIVNAIHFFKSANQFIWPSWRDGFTHMYLYSFDAQDPLASAKLVGQLENGPYEVQSISQVDEANGVVYFMANKEDARRQNLYALPLKGGEAKRVTADPGVHTVALAENAKYFVDTFSSLNEQSRMQICPTTGGKCNEIFRSRVYDDYDRIPAQFVDFKAEDGTVLHGAILLPRQGTPGAVNGKYPLVMNPYGGPHGQTVRDDYKTMGVFDQILAHRGIAVLKVDNRGMGNRGKKFATATFENLYEVELKDQLTALDQAIAQFPIDNNRLGWWGWSYGGSMTLWAMTHSDRFKAGVSVAPVTDWHWYDTAYTERYMGLPDQNKAGYQRTSIVKAAPQLEGQLFIAHGTSDDNVHVQNTMQFVFALENNVIPFDMRVFPQKTHAISGKNTRLGLYTRILDQFDRVLLGSAK